MLKFFRTDYGEKQPAAAVAANQMAGAGACVCRYRCVGLNHVVEAFRRFSCQGPTDGNTIPVCPDAVSRRHPGVSQELVYRLSGDGQTFNSAPSACNRNRRRACSCCQSGQRPYFQLSPDLLCRARADGAWPVRHQQFARVPGAGWFMVCR